MAPNNDSIVLVTTSYPSESEGSAAAGSFVKDFAEALTRHGIQVSVVAPAQDGQIVEELGVTVYRFPVHKLPLSLLRVWLPKDWWQIFQVVTVGKKWVDNAVREQKASHVLALWVLPCGYWARKAAEKHGITYSTWALGSDIWSLGKIPIVKRILRETLQAAKNCFADGVGLKNDVQEIARRPVQFLPSSRDVHCQEPRIFKRQGPYKFLFLGRWHPNKGIDLLLDAIAMLDVGDWKEIESFQIYGGGPLEGDVKGLLRMLPDYAQEKIELGGFVDKRQAEKLISSSDYLVIPSRIESVPVIFSDAMKLGCAVISTPVGDLPDLIATSQCGLLTDDISARSLAQGIRSALKTCPETYSAGIEQMAGMFDIDGAVGQFLTAEGLQKVD